MKKLSKIIAGSLGFLPLIAGAQNLDYFKDLTDEGTNLLNNIVIFLVALAVVWFIVNVIRYTIANDEEKKGEAKSQMIWGIIAIAVIVSVWGLVEILGTAFDVDTDSAPSDINNLLPKP